MGKVCKNILIVLKIVCLTILYIFIVIHTPVALFVWLFTGDGIIFTYFYSITQILIYFLILQSWIFFRNKAFWAIIMAIELPILITSVPVMITDPSFESFFTAIEDYQNYGTVSSLFVVFLLEVVGVAIYYILFKTTKHIGTISFRVFLYIALFDCLVLLGGSIYLVTDNNSCDDDSNSYMMTYDERIYINEKRTADSLYVEISDNESFADKFEFSANIAEAVQENILVQIYPPNVIAIDYPDSLISIGSLSKYSVFFEKTPNPDLFLSEKECRFSCYYFWFSFSKKSRMARYLENNRNNETIKTKDIRLIETNSSFNREE